MARAPLKFKQSDIVRAVNAVRAAGLVVARTKIGLDGSIELFHGNDNTPPAKSANEWDEVLHAQKTAKVLPGLR